MSKFLIGLLIAYIPPSPQVRIPGPGGGTAPSGLSWHLIDETPQYANITQAQWSAILP